MQNQRSSSFTLLFARAQQISICAPYALYYLSHVPYVLSHLEQLGRPLGFLARLERGQNHTHIEVKDPPGCRSRNEPGQATSRIKVVHLVCLLRRGAGSSPTSFGGKVPLPAIGDYPCSARTRYVR